MSDLPSGFSSPSIPPIPSYQHSLENSNTVHAIPEGSAASAVLPWEWPEGTNSSFQPSKSPWSAVPVLEQFGEALKFTLASYDKVKDSVSPGRLPSELAQFVGQTKWSEKGAKEASWSGEKLCEFLRMMTQACTQGTEASVPPGCVRVSQIDRHMEGVREMQQRIVEGAKQRESEAEEALKKMRKTQSINQELTGQLLECHTKLQEWSKIRDSLVAENEALKAHVPKRTQSSSQTHSAQNTQPAITILKRSDRRER